MSVLERVRVTDDQAFEVAPRAHLDKARTQLKHDLIDMLGLTTVADMVAGDDATVVRHELTVACDTILNTRDYGSVDADSKDELVREVIDEVVGLGPLQPLLDDPSVSEVMVNGCSSLYYERGGSLFSTERVFDSPEQVMMVIDRILAPLGRRLDESSPIVNARLANGDRVNAVISPVALEGPVITIRKFSDRITTMAELERLGSVPQWYARLLSWAVRHRMDIAVAGGTGSGKTTLLNALSCEIGHQERIVTIEDSAELRFESHPHVVRLEARDASIEGTGAVTIRDLVKNALRMRPDRIVVGEVRGEECIDMLQAMNTGHDGSLTTLHAGTAQEAVLRLVLMARFGMDLPAQLIEEQVATALDLIVMSRRMPDGKRYITSMSLVTRGSSGVELTECVSFDEAARTWNLLFEPPFVARGLAEGTLDPREVATWRQEVSSSRPW